MTRLAQPVLPVLLMIGLVLTTGIILAQDENKPLSRQVEAMERGRMYTQSFYKGDLAEVHSHFTASMKQEFDYKKLATMLTYLTDELGTEETILAEEVDPWGGFLEYRRKVRFAYAQETFEVVFLMREDDKLPIAGFFIRDARAGEQLRQERAKKE